MDIHPIDRSSTIEIPAWIELNRRESATPAAANLRKALTKIKRKPIDLGQGREKKTLPLALKIMKAIKGITIHSDYNSPPEALNEAAARWMCRILHIETTKKSTFSVQQGGRFGVAAAFRVLAEALTSRSDTNQDADLLRADKILMPKLSWPMIGSMLKKAGLQHEFYDMEPGEFANSIRKSLEKDHAHISGIYANSPHNPSGEILTSKDFRELFAVVNEFNSGEYLKQRGGRKITIVADIPYPHACAEIQKNGKRYLDTGLEAFTREQPTPWFVVASFSKIFGMANPGATIIAVHPDHVESFGGDFNPMSGLWWMREYFGGLKKILAKKNDDIILDHFVSLRRKYKINRAKFEELFGESDLGKVMRGEPGMLGVLKIDMRKYIGKVGSKHDGSPFLINDINDIVEYLANKYSVVAVSQGEDKETGEGLLRFSAAESPKRYAEGLRRVKEGLTELINFPVIFNRATNSNQPQGWQEPKFDEMRVA